MKSIYAKVLYVYLKFVFFTSRVRHENFERYEQARLVNTKARMIASWHGNSSNGVALFSLIKACALVSPSRDGSIAAYVIEKFGGIIVRTYRGFSGKNGLIKAKKLIDEGIDVVVTVDGGKGPAFRCKPGVIFMAKTCGIPIVPLNVHASKKIVFKKVWDQHQLPLPFGTITFHWGHALTVDASTKRSNFFLFEEELAKRISSLGPANHPARSHSRRDKALV